LEAKKKAEEDAKKAQEEKIILAPIHDLIEWK